MSIGTTSKSGIRYWGLPLLAICAAIMGGLPARAQQVAVQRSGAATAWSTAILAQSDYLRSQGDFLTSAATARQINAVAAEQEMKNSVRWVNTYFERRRLNREYRAAENPSYLERAEIRNTQYRRLINDHAPTIVGKDVTNELNWMVHDLLAHSSYQMFLPGSSGSLTSSPDNIPLSAAEKHHLRLSEGRNVGGKTLIFRADTAQMLETRWPVPLRDDRFEALRTRFEAARDAALADLKADGKLDRASETALMEAVDHMSDELNAAYPLERKAASAQVFFGYLVSKRYLQSLALATYRLIEAQSAAAFDDSYRFQGASLVELLQHLMTKGLEFAPPEPGDEGTYRYLFGAVRTLYLQVVPDPGAK